MAGCYPNWIAPTCKEPKIIKFEEYHKYYSQCQHPTPWNPTKPWTPFRTHAEFNFAEVALNAALNKRQVDTLLKLFHHCVGGEDILNLKDHAELTHMWELASLLHTRVCLSMCPNCKSYLNHNVMQVETTVLSVLYTQNDICNFTLCSCSLWEWGVSLVRDHILAPHIQWDAQHLLKFNGKEYIQFM